MTDRSGQIAGLEGNYIFFSVGKEEYGVLSRQLVGVEQTPAVRRVPKAPEFIKGVANVHGRIITVVDTCNRFEAAPSELKTMMLIQLEGVFFGLLAEQVTGIAHLDKAAIEPVNPVLIKETMPFICGMAVFEDRLVHLLDLEAIVYSGISIKRKEKTAYEDYSKKIQKNLRRIQQIAKRPYLVLQIGRETYGLAITDIKEVLTQTRIEKISDGPDYLAGVIKTAAGLIPVIDMKKKYTLKSSSHPFQARIAVVETGHGVFGMLADSAAEMISIALDDIRERPKAITGGQTNHIASVAILEKGKRLMAILNPEQVLTAKDFKSFSTIKGLEKAQLNKKRNPREEVCCDLFSPLKWQGMNLPLTWQTWLK